jgi:hypothetical protein
MIIRFLAALSFTCVLFAAVAFALPENASDLLSRAVVPQQRKALVNREIAARFAPLFYQALGDNPRSDLPTNFDFDGDWRGDNNWAHSEDTKYSLKAYVYYAVAETTSHYFIHYSVFHPRDYKAGERRGTILSELLREGAKLGGQYDPTGLVEEATLAHENDMEGCLIVVLKDGTDLERAQTVFVETLHHNNFSRYVTAERGASGFGRVELQDQRPLLYIEPKGHGIEAFTRSDKQVGKKEFLLYKYSGQAEDPAVENLSGLICKDPVRVPCPTVGYDLVPIRDTLWAHAENAPNHTYAKTCDYQQISITMQQPNDRVTERKIDVGKVGCAFVGLVGGRDMARPPWAWFDKDERSRPLGHWFFDPAGTVKRDFGLDDKFSTTYLRLSVWDG